MKMSSRDASYLPRMERLVQLFRCSAVNPAGLSGREQLTGWTCGVRVRTRFSLRSARVASPKATCLGGRDQRGAALPLAPQMPPDRQIAFVSRRSRVAIGGPGLHMQTTWKWHKHVDTRIGFTSTNSWAESQPGDSLCHSALDISPRYIIWITMGSDLYASKVSSLVKAHWAVSGTKWVCSRTHKQNTRTVWQCCLELSLHLEPK